MGSSPRSQSASSRRTTISERGGVCTRRLDNQFVIPEPEERLLDLDGIRLSCRIWPGEGTPLVCLHGLENNARWWDPVAARLSPAHPAVAVDLRGHGRSDRPVHGYSLPEVGSDLIQLLEALDLHDPVLVGHSWGASVALWLAGALPEVRGVVCVDGGILDLRTVLGSDWEVAREQMLPPVHERLDSAGVRRLLSSSPLAVEAGVEAATWAVLGDLEEGPDSWLHPRLDLERYLEIARFLYEQELDPLWELVRCPVLFLLADDPATFPEHKAQQAERASALIAGGSEARFLSGLHDLPLQHPRAVADALQGFVAAIESRGATGLKGWRV